MNNAIGEDPIDLSVVRTPEIAVDVYPVRDTSFLSGKAPAALDAADADRWIADLRGKGVLDAPRSWSVRAESGSFSAGGGRKGVVLVRGAVPGPNGGYVTIRKSIKKQKKT